MHDISINLQPISLKKCNNHKLFVGKNVIKLSFSLEKMQQTLFFPLKKCKFANK